MTPEALLLLQYSASTENVSVEHYPDGSRCYAVPVLTMLFDDDYASMDQGAIFDTSTIYIDCTYKMMVGFPYMQCKLSLEKDDKVAILEEVSIPLDKRRQDAHQRRIVTLINQCSKRIIEQEMKKNKIALAAVANSTLHNNQYN